MGSEEPSPQASALHGPTLAMRLGEIEAAAPCPHDLIGRAQAGDEQAKWQLYHEHFAHVYGYLLETLKHHDDAEDACQHVFLRMFEALPSYELEGEPFRAWLFTLVRNHAIDRLRAASRARTTPVDPHELRGMAQAPPDVAPESRAERLAAAVQALPQLQRQTIALIYAHDLQATEAAAVLDRKADAVRQLHRRALANLAVALAL
jgi:RNA polymerase sigma-70 factor (ECF subfamily)